MVKPALAYLDIIHMLRETFPVPIVAYNVSGEYTMVKTASKMGFLDEKKIIWEILTSIKRAGADLIITYFAKEVARMLKEGEI
jgi:porphobilinogen synthase